MAESASQKLDELKTQTGTELDKLRRELLEIENLIRQTGSEVEKLQQRELTIASRLRDLDVNVDKYEKRDIKNMFTSALELQMRMQSMRGELKSLQARQQSMKDRQSQLFGLQTVLEQLAGDASRSGGASSPAGNAEGGSEISHIIQAQENERYRIAQQIHDELTQSLSNLVLRAEICLRMIDQNVGMARSELAALQTAIKKSLQETRRFTFDLRPMILDDLGLVPTLKRYVQQFKENTGVEVHLMMQGSESRLPPHYEVVVFRFVQEALNNVARHAKANQARVLLDSTGGQLHVSIQDDGEGFSVREVMASTDGRRNMGLATLRQYAESMLHGEFGIESAPGQGTRVAASIPLPS